MRAIKARAERRKVWLEARLVSGGRRSPVLVADVSRTGCLVAIDELPAIGSVLTLDIPAIGVREVRVSRRVLEFSGCAFLEPLADGEEIAKPDFARAGTPRIEPNRPPLIAD